MLEAFVALIFPFWLPDLALPMSTCLLFFMAYSMPLRLAESKTTYFILTASFLCLMPIEYYMISFMPRDFISGIFITSLAFLFARKDRWWSHILVGFFCILGWSFNNNAAILGGCLSVFVAFPNNRLSVSAVMYMAVGYAVGGSFHLALAHYFEMHPELIVHKAWDFHYAWKQLWDGWKNLDRHFAWINPAFHYQGWLYLPLLLSILIYAWIKKQYAVLASTITLFVMVFLSFGVLKIHDGRDSVFFSHERMFLALPITVLFLISQFNWSIKGLKVLAGIGIVSVVFSIWGIDEVIANQVRTNADHVVSVTPVDEFYNDCQALHALSEKFDAEILLIGPNAEQFGHIHSSGCNSIYDDIYVIDPGYERKTWDMRAIDTMRVSQFIWHSTRLAHAEISSPTVSSLTEIEGFPNTFLVKGSEMNALEIYRSLGVETSNY